MIKIKNECVGCDYCIGCGARHTKRFCCDNCFEEEELYIFNDEELCISCVREALRGEETTDGTCDRCGEECAVYKAYGLCEECILESLETVEDSDE